MANTNEAGSASPAERNDVGASGNLGLAEIQGMFTEAAEAAETPETVDVSEEEEAPDPEEGADAGAETDEDSPETVSEDDPGDEPEEDEDDVLSELKPKAAEKARKRIDKLTARAKTAEEELQRVQSEREEFQRRLDAMEQKLQSGAQQESQASRTLQDKIANASTVEELKAVVDEAKKIRKWARDNQHQEYVKLGDREMDREEVVHVYNEVEDLLDEAAPRRFNYLKRRNEADQLAYQQFPEWTDRKHPDHALVQQIYGQFPDLSEALQRVPQGRYAAAVMARGIRAIEAEAAAKQQQGEGGGEVEKPAPAKKRPAVAQRVPGMDGGTAPPASGNSAKRSAGSGSISLEDLSAIL